jgi:hypothetical protein
MTAERTKAMHIGIMLSSVPQVAEEQVLLDSGASKNLINEESWRTLGTKAFTLPKPVSIYNLDGMENVQGRISQYCWLKVRQGDKEYMMRFFLTKMGKVHLILGHPFLSIFNPEINWQKWQIIGPAIDISMIGFNAAQGLLRQTQLQALRVYRRQPRSGETIYYRRVIATQEEPYLWQKEQAKAAIRRLPKEHWKVFYQEKQPPRRKGNKKVPSWHGNPREISCKIYPLSKEEEGHVWQFLREEQKRGYISQGASPAFIRDKRERQLIMGYRRLNRYVIQNNSKMTSIYHTQGSSSDRRSPPKLPLEEPESTSAKGKGKQKAIPKAHTSPLSELPFTPETDKGCLWPSTLPTSLHLKKVSWRHLNSIPNSTKGSAAEGSGQNHEVNHKPPNNTRELPKPLSL